MKAITLASFLTEAQIEACLEIAGEPEDGESLHKKILRRVIDPNIAEINRKLGQENDPRYLAYAIEAVLGEAARRGLS